jgi:hypothetical protein
VTVTNGGSAPYARVALNGGATTPREALSYTVPATVPDAPAALPAARLTNYVFAHSKYSSVLGQNDVLNDLLSEADSEDAGAAAAAAAGRAANDTAVPQPPGTRSPEARVAP